MKDLVSSLTSALLLGLVAALTLNSCSAPAAKIPAERVVLADNERVLWLALRAAIYEADYAVGAGANSGSRLIESGWKLDLQPFRGAGKRTRVIASYNPVPSEPGSDYESFDVSIRVEKEINQSLVRQLDPRYAKWESADDEEFTAKAIMQRLEGSLGTSEFRLNDTSRPRGLEDAR